MDYPTDLSSIQKDYIKENFPEIMLTKSPKDIFEVINGIFYVARTGCQWNMLPGSYPSWRTFYNFFRKWTDAGIFAKIPGSMLAVARQRLGRKPDATVVVVDSQSVRSGLHQSENTFKLHKE